MVIFDLDGTLYRTHETSLPPLYETCRKYNLTLNPEDERVLLFTTNDTLLDRIAPDMSQEQREQFKRDIHIREIEAIKEKGRLFDGIKNLLSDLSSDKIDMAICGMGSKEYIETVLARCNIAQYFKYVYPSVKGLTKSQRLKELLYESKLKSDECIFVGDSVTDMTAADDNGIPFIGINWGYGAKEISEYDAIAGNISQLKSFIYLFSVFSKVGRDIKSLDTPIIIGVNGVDTSGKTEFSIGLQRFLEHRGFHTQMIHLDDFHNQRYVRMKDNSPEGYISNAFDMKTLEKLLDEIKAGPIDRKINLLDLDSDTYTNMQHYKTTGKSVVILEGTMLYRPPLDSLFTYKIFLDISFDEVLRRAIIRDVPKYGKDFLQKYIDRYIPAQKIYLDRFHAKENSHLIIDNNDFGKPIIVQNNNVITS